MTTAKVGDRVEFQGFGEPDPYSRLAIGTKGTVSFVDDLGTVHVKWDDGSRLGLVTRGIDPAKPFSPDRFTVTAEEAN